MLLSARLSASNQSPTASRLPSSYQSIRSLAPYALGGGSWLLLLALLVTVTAALWVRFEIDYGVAITVLLIMACLLLAGRHAGRHAAHINSTVN